MSTGSYNGAGLGCIGEILNFKEGDDPNKIDKNYFPLNMNLE